MTEIVTLDLPAALVERVTALSAELGKPNEWVIEHALDAYQTDSDEHRRMMLEGFASIDAGEVVSQEAMEAWAASLTTSQPLPLPQPGQ